MELTNNLHFIESVGPALGPESTSEFKALFDQLGTHYATLKVSFLSIIIPSPFYLFIDECFLPGSI